MVVAASGLNVSTDSLNNTHGILVQEQTLQVLVSSIGVVVVFTVNVSYSCVASQGIQG